MSNQNFGFHFSVVRHAVVGLQAKLNIIFNTFSPRLVCLYLSTDKTWMGIGTSTQLTSLSTFDKRFSNESDEVPSSKKFPDTIYESESSDRGKIYGSKWL